MRVIQEIAVRWSRISISGKCGAASLFLAGVLLILFAFTVDWMQNSDNGFGMAQIVVATTGCVLLAFAIVASRGTAWQYIAKWSLAILATLASLFFAEVMFRCIGYDFDHSADVFEATPIFYRQPTVPVPPVFFRRPGPAVWNGKVLSVHVRAQGGPEEAYAEESQVTIRYDSQGFRNPTNCTDWEIVVVGDSFVELGHLPYDDLFTTRLGRLVNKTVKNLGASSTGALTHISYLKNFGQAKSTTDCMLVFFEGNDARDTLREARELEEFETTGERNYRELTRQTSFLRALNRAFLRQNAHKQLMLPNAYFRQDQAEIPVTVRPYLLKSDLGLGTMEKAVVVFAVREWANAARALQMRPWLLYMPCKRRALHGQLRFTANTPADVIEWQPTDLPAFMERLCKENGVSFVDLTPPLAKAARNGDLTYNAVFDSHLNALGCRIVAEVIAEHLQADIAAR